MLVNTKPEFITAEMLSFYLHDDGNIVCVWEHEGWIFTRDIDSNFLMYTAWDPENYTRPSRNEWKLKDLEEWAEEQGDVDF